MKPQTDTHFCAIWGCQEPSKGGVISVRAGDKHVTVPLCAEHVKQYLNDDKPTRIAVEMYWVDEILKGLETTKRYFVVEVDDESGEIDWDKGGSFSPIEVIGLAELIKDAYLNGSRLDEEDD